MRGSRNFCQGGPGLFFVLNFYSFTVALQRFISKKTIILQGFGGGGGVQPIRGGRGGGLEVQMLISRNP